MFRATICKSIELFEYNKLTNKYEGVDPDSYQECGFFSIEKPNLNDLKKEITNQLGDAMQWYDEGECYIISCDLEYEHYIPKKERIPGIETYSIFISEIISKKINKPW